MLVVGLKWEALEEERLVRQQQKSKFARNKWTGQEERFFLIAWTQEIIEMEGAKKTVEFTAEMTQLEGVGGGDPVSARRLSKGESPRFQ